MSISLPSSIASLSIPDTQPRVIKPTKVTVISKREAKPRAATEIWETF